MQADPPKPVTPIKVIHFETRAVQAAAHLGTRRNDIPPATAATTMIITKGKNIPFVKILVDVIMENEGVLAFEPRDRDQKRPGQIQVIDRSQVEAQVLSVCL